MYSTKIDFPKGKEGFPNPKGDVPKMQFVTLGDPYNKKNRKKNDRFNGKQFTTNPGRGNAGIGDMSTVPNSTLFVPFKYTSDPWKPQVKYTKTQPLENRKLGFGSRDAFKTDEFTNTVRTETYREQLRRENQILNMQMDQRDQMLGIKNDAGSKNGEGKNDAAEEDLDELDTTLFSRINSKKHEVFGVDRRQALRARKRRLGHYRLSSRDYGAMCDQPKVIFAAKCTHGSTSATAQFFDTGHLGIHRE